MPPRPSQAAAELSAELEAKLLHRLICEWAAINDTYLDDTLQLPVFQLSEGRACLGRWHRELRRLEISRPLVLERPWVEVIEVLKHEIAHQYVDERLRVAEDPHGPAFRRICARLGIDGHATSDPAERADPSPADDPTGRIIARIHKLLALAQSPNQHEAETAAMTARRLMLKFNIEVDRAQPRADARRDYGFRHLGRPSGRILEHDRRLASILTRYFFVESVWIPVYRPLEGKRGSVLEICGRAPNLAMAEHVHAFLSGTAERLWDAYRQETGRSSNLDRQAYLAGVMRGFEAKLAAQSADFKEQGVVWVPTAGLRTYFARRHPRLATIHRSGAQRNEAYAEGARAGREIVLSQPIEAGASAATSPRALRERN